MLQQVRPESTCACSLLQSRSITPWQSLRRSNWTCRSREVLAHEPCGIVCEYPQQCCTCPSFHMRRSACFLRTLEVGATQTGPLLSQPLVCGCSTSTAASALLQPHTSLKGRACTSRHACCICASRCMRCAAACRACGLSAPGRVGGSDAQKRTKVGGSLVLWAWGRAAMGGGMVGKH